MILPAALGLSVLGGAVHGAFHRNSFLFGRVLGHLPTDELKVALTFDDGPNPDATPRILDTLGEYDVRATFFILGRHAERWPISCIAPCAKDIRLAITDTFTGSFISSLRTTCVATCRWGNAQSSAPARHPLISSVLRMVSEVHGFPQSPARSASGRSDGRWACGTAISPGVKRIVDQTIEGVKPGSIVLLHDGDGYNADGNRMQTAAALPKIITGLRERGYEFVTLPVE